MISLVSQTKVEILPVEMTLLLVHKNDQVL